MDIYVSRPCRFDINNNYGMDYRIDFRRPMVNLVLRYKENTRERKLIKFGLFFYLNYE